MGKHGNKSLRCVSPHLAPLGGSHCSRQSLLPDATAQDRLSTPRDVFAELQRTTKEEEPPDMVPFHSQHGFLWTYIPAVITTLFDAFPTDLALEICTDLLWERLDNQTMRVIPGLDLIRECRHGFGHVVFYELSNRQLGVSRERFTARRKFRTHAGFVLTDENTCEAVRICNETPWFENLSLLCLWGHVCKMAKRSWSMFVDSKRLIRNDEQYKNCLCYLKILVLYKGIVCFSQLHLKEEWENPAP